MSHKLVRPRAGVAKIPSGGEELFVTESHPRHMVITYWILFYVVPAAGAFFLKGKGESSTRRILTIHAWICLSIVLLSLIGARLTFRMEIVPAAFLLASAFLSIFLLGTYGLAYCISSFVQQWCILLAATYLTSAISILPAALATSMVYSMIHRLGSNDWLWKFPMLFFGGIGSIYLYVWLHDPVLNIALHILLGTLLIRVGLLYNPLKS